MCFEYFILKFDNLIEWADVTNLGIIRIRSDVLKNIVDYRINIEFVNSETMEYISKFKNFSTERILKSITRKLTEKHEWAVKGEDFGRCWKVDCCYDYREMNKCKQKAPKSYNDKMNELINSPEVQRVCRVFNKSETDVCKSISAF